MARTKASVGSKVSSGKSSKARAAAPPPPPSPKTGRGSTGQRSGLAGCNPVCPRDTPAWQLPITRFFSTSPADPTAPTTAPAATGDAAHTTTAGPSKPRRRNVIESDDECEPHAPDDSVTDASAELPPLDGDACHKIAEYFPKVASDGGGRDDANTDDTGMDWDNKENVSGGRGSGKRLLDDAHVSVSKKAKILA